MIAQGIFRRVLSNSLRELRLTMPLSQYLPGVSGLVPRSGTRSCRSFRSRDGKGMKAPQGVDLTVNVMAGGLSQILPSSLPSEQ